MSDREAHALAKLVSRMQFASQTAIQARVRAGGGGTLEGRRKGGGGLGPSGPN
jgi:hypothetical protein